MNNQSSQQDRSIRVFVSSTVRDMQEDRDYLVKFVFPQLRKLCESRGVTWGEVDLRWGITEEEAAEGEVSASAGPVASRAEPGALPVAGRVGGD